MIGKIKTLHVTKPMLHAKVLSHVLWVRMAKLQPKYFYGLQIETLLCDKIKYDIFEMLDILKILFQIFH